MNEQIEELIDLAKQAGLEIQDSVIENFKGTDDELFKCLIRVTNLWVDGEIKLHGGNVIDLINLGK